MQDAGWDKARVRYENFVQAHRRSRILYLELGVGGNTPVIIKYPFWRFTLENPMSPSIQTERFSICGGQNASP